MLIGGVDISKDVITLGTSFSTFVYIRVRYLFALIGGNLYTTRNYPLPQRVIPKIDLNMIRNDPQIFGHATSLI